jgi:hypothetical protein
MDLAEFYSTYDHADGFGSTAGGRLNPHRGGDLPHAAGTPIPTYEPIRITLNRWHAGLGWIAEGVTPAGRYIGFRHMLAQCPHPIGAELGRSATVGLVGDSGTLANGDHLCTTNASGPGGVLGDPNLVSDPWPYIEAAISGTASAGRPTPADEARKREEHMRTIIISGTEFGGTGAGYVLNTDELTAKPLANMGELLALEAQGWKRAVLNPKDFNEVLATYRIHKV